MALLQHFGIITTLPFSKYASPIFAQKKPNGKLGLLVELLVEQQSSPVEPCFVASRKNNQHLPWPHGNEEVSPQYRLTLPQ